MAAKFTMATPGLVSNEAHIESAARVENAVSEMAARQERGQAQQVEKSVDGPTGSTYKERRQAAEKEAREVAQRKSDREDAQMAQARLERQMQQVEDAGSDSDEEFLNDPELQQLRAQRVNQLQGQHAERMANLSKGHGQYREIVQDEFLPEVTGSEKVACHFYHRDFERCKVMDKHLAKLALQHIECKFIKIDAEKTPFFVNKLQIEILPTVVYFKDGIAADRQVGFEDLTDGLVGREDEWPTTRLAKLMSEAEMLNYIPIPDQTELAMWDMDKKSAISAGLYNDYDSDE